MMITNATKIRPCRHDPMQPTTCPTCRRIATDDRFADLRGPIAQTAPRRKTVSLPTLPCAHRGLATGETRPCKTCTETVQVPLYSCRIHHDCTLDKLVTSADSGAPVQSCRICNEREAPNGIVIQARPVRRDFGPRGHIFSHYGDDGDLVYALSAVYAVCSSTDSEAEIVLYHHTGARHPYDREHAAKTVLLVECQPYISTCRWSPHPVGVRLDTAIRKFFHDKGQLGDHYYNWLNLTADDRIHPWLVVEQPNRVAPVVLARSARYHGTAFPWERVVDSTRGRNVFVGTPAEHKDFCARFGNVPYYPTSDLLALAQVIAGAELFVGNQSCPRAIAEGLKIPVCVEEATGDSDAPGPPDTHYERPTAWYGTRADFWCPPLQDYHDMPLAAVPADPPTHLGTIDPLPHVYVSDRDWANSPRVAARHLDAMRQVLASPAPYPGGSGDGIVTAGEGQFWASLVVMLRQLRHTGCTLPVEVWYRGNAGAIRPEQVAGLNVTLINTDAAGRHHGDNRVPTGDPKVGGWEAKLYALTHTRFGRAIWLDADLYPLIDPTPLLDECGQGLAIWTDSTDEAKQHLRWDKVWPSMNTPNMTYFSSGQFALDRKAAWKPLQLAHWMCQHSDYYFQHGLGDQDMMRAAWTACGAPWHDLGELVKLPSAKHVFCYYYNGVPMFIHRSGPKLLQLDLPLEWEITQSFADAIRTRDELAELAAIADRSLVSPDRLKVIRDCVLSTNHLHECLAEVGVYRGGTAKLIRTFASVDDPLLLFDTFAGIPADDEHINGHRKGDFSENVSVSDVLEYVGGTGVFPRVGIFPEAPLDAVRYRFVHVDGDIAQTTRAAIDYFAPRMVAGGIMVFDDYDAPSCPSVKLLVDAAFGERVEVIAEYQAVVKFVT